MPKSVGPGFEQVHNGLKKHGGSSSKTLLPIGSKEPDLCAADSTWKAHVISANVMNRATYAMRNAITCA